MASAAEKAPPSDGFPGSPASPGCPALHVELVVQRLPTWPGCGGWTAGAGTREMTTTRSSPSFAPSSTHTATLPPTSGPPSGVALWVMMTSRRWMGSETNRTVTPTVPPMRNVGCALPLQSFTQLELPGVHPPSMRRLGLANSRLDISYWPGATKMVGPAARAALNVLKGEKGVPRPESLPVALTKTPSVIETERTVQLEPPPSIGPPPPAPPPVEPPPAPPPVEPPPVPPPASDTPPPAPPPASLVPPPPPPPSAAHSATCGLLRQNSSRAPPQSKQPAARTVAKTATTTRGRLTRHLRGPARRRPPAARA